MVRWAGCRQSRIASTIGGDRYGSRLQGGDEVSIVIYGTQVDVLVPLMPASQARDQIQRALASFEAGGSTDLHQGWLLGAKLLDGRTGANRQCPVIPLSDGQARGARRARSDCRMAGCRRLGLFYRGSGGQNPLKLGYIAQLEFTDAGTRYNLGIADEVELNDSDRLSSARQRIDDAQSGYDPYLLAPVHAYRLVGSDGAYALLVCLIEVHG
jgi:hypothetical protein